MTIDPTDPNAFFGTEDPVDEELAYLGSPVEHVDPLSGVRIVAPGEDLSTMIVDPLTSVTDRRTPEPFKPFEAIVADLAGVTPDALRLIRGQQATDGMIALFEELDTATATFNATRYVVACYDGKKPRVGYETKLFDAEYRYAMFALVLGIPIYTLEKP